MKIIHIINSLNTGGAEKLVLDILPKFAAKGHTIELILLDGSEYPFLKKLEEQPTIAIHKLTNANLYNPNLIFKIAPLIKDADIVHVHLFPALYWAAFAKGFARSKAKFIFTEHNTWNRRIGNRLYRMIDRLVYKKYDKIICISEEIKQILITHLKISEKFFEVIQNGVDLSEIKKATPVSRQSIETSIKDSDTLIIMTAAFREQKDQKTLIRAMTQLPPTCKLILVGDGTTKKECIVLTRELRLEERVFFLGWRMDVPSLLKTADLVVLSSYYEGLSLSSIEGLASTKPFLASNVPGLKEIVEGAGILFPRGEHNILADEILKLMNNEDYYEEICLRCIQRAENFNIEKMINLHLQFYQELA
ncbi:glycosyltransferase [Altibacter lentus]|uniref:glycosyltransferase n=1 Tax=Altibacter lentus TaxID=1223410 RepID=UPI00054D92A9|nr:glycosyltransferase [Altibacter lentus]